MKLAAGGKLTTIDFEGRGQRPLRPRARCASPATTPCSRSPLQQLKLGRTDVAGDWKRVPGGVELSLRGPSLELPRVRAMIKARDELAAKEPAGAAAAARANTKMTLQIQQVLTERGTLGYVNGTPRLWPASASPSADLTIGAGKGSTFRVTPAGQGRNALPLRRRFRPDAEGRRLARRAGRRLSPHRGPVRRRRRRLAARPASSSSGPTGCRG